MDTLIFEGKQYDSVYVIGDVHSRIGYLKRIIATIKKDSDGKDKDNILIIQSGDLFDLWNRKEAYNENIITRINDLKKEGYHYAQIIGNHDRPDLLEKICDKLYDKLYVCITIGKCRISHTVLDKGKVRELLQAKEDTSDDNLITDINKLVNNNTSAVQGIIGDHHIKRNKTDKKYMGELKDNKYVGELINNNDNYIMDNNYYHIFGHDASCKTASNTSFILNDYTLSLGTDVKDCDFKIIKLTQCAIATLSIDNRGISKSNDWLNDLPINNNYNITYDVVKANDNLTTKEILYVIADAVYKNNSDDRCYNLCIRFKDNRCFRYYTNDKELTDTVLLTTQPLDTSKQFNANNYGLLLTTTEPTETHLVYRYKFNDGFIEPLDNHRNNDLFDRLFKIKIPELIDYEKCLHKQSVEEILSKY